MVKAEQLDQWIDEAKALGAEHAHNAASWATDGNMDVAERAKVLELLRAGDPLADNYLPRRPNLSGEFADDPTPQSLAVQIAGEDFPEDEAIEEALAEAYEQAVLDVFESACEAELIKFCEQ